MKPSRIILEVWHLNFLVEKVFIVETTKNLMKRLMKRLMKEDLNPLFPGKIHSVSPHYTCYIGEYSFSYIIRVIYVPSPTTFG